MARITMLERALHIGSQNLSKAVSFCMVEVAITIRIQIFRYLLSLVGDMALERLQRKWFLLAYLPFCHTLKHNLPHFTKYDEKSIIINELNPNCYLI